MAAKGLSQADTKQDHPLQAIVVCDAWGDEARWGPLVRRNRTDDEEFDDSDVGGEPRPWCLLPLLNSPLLAWTLECLVSEGVEDIFLFVREGVEEVRSWLKTSPYSSQPGLRLTLRPTTALTPGDVLREVDGLGILSPADFLVVQAGYVGNVKLGDKVKEFAARRAQDPTLSMSCVVTSRVTPTTSKFAVHVLAKKNDQLLHYEESAKFPRLKAATLPREILSGGKEVTSRADLEAVGIAICSVEVPPLFTENFDYQFFYPDFVNGILTSDLLGKTICCTIIGEGNSGDIRFSTEWAAVIGNTRSYDSVSQSLLARRAYPLAPDENMPEPGERYEQRRGKVYYGKDVDVARTSTIGNTSLLGRNLVVGPGTAISLTVLGPDVSIGASCSILGSYIFAGAQVGDNCSVHHSIIGEGAQLAAGSVVQDGSLVAPGVKLGTGARLVGRRVSLEKPEDDVQVETGPSTLGPDHVGFLWPEESPLETQDDDDDDLLDPRNYDITRLGAHLETLHLSSSSSSLSTLSRASSATSLTSLNSLAVSDTQQVAGFENLAPASTQNDFVSECTLSLDRSFAEGHTVDDAAIELKTLRMASNVPLDKVRAVVIPYILARAADAAAVPALISRWGGLIERLTGEQESAMVDCLLMAQTYAAARSGEESSVKMFFLRVLRAFYEEDIVNDEAVFAWYKSPSARTVGGEAGKRLWADARQFVEALAELEDESDDSEE